MTHGVLDDGEPGRERGTRANRLVLAHARAADMYRQLAVLCLRSGDGARAEQHLHLALIHFGQLEGQITRACQGAKRYG